MIKLGQSRDIWQFQSTPSAWRVTRSINKPEDTKNISIHTLRVEGDFTLNVGLILLPISIHTLRVEGDRFFEK